MNPTSSYADGGPDIVIARLSMSLWSMVGMTAAGAGAMVIAWFSLLPFPFGEVGRVALFLSGAGLVVFGVAIATRALQGWESLVGGTGWIQRKDPFWLHRVLSNSRLEGDLSDARLSIDENVPTPGPSKKPSGVLRVEIRSSRGRLRVYGNHVNEDLRERFAEWLALQATHENEP